MTFPISKHNDELVLFRKYTPEEYPKYDNYDAINVDKTCDIPELIMTELWVFQFLFLTSTIRNSFKLLGIIGSTVWI